MEKNSCANKVEGILLRKSYMERKQFTDFTYVSQQAHEAGEHTYISPTGNTLKSCSPWPQLTMTKMQFSFNKRWGLKAIETVEDATLFAVELLCDEAMQWQCRQRSSCTAIKQPMQTSSATLIYFLSESTQVSIYFVLWVFHRISLA